MSISYLLDSSAVLAPWSKPPVTPINTDGERASPLLSLSPLSSSFSFLPFFSYRSHDLYSPRPHEADRRNERYTVGIWPVTPPVRSVTELRAGLLSASGSLHLRLHRHLHLLILLLLSSLFFVVIRFLGKLVILRMRLLLLPSPSTAFSVFICFTVKLIPFFFIHFDVVDSMKSLFGQNHSTLIMPRKVLENCCFIGPFHSNSSTNI